MITVGVNKWEMDHNDGRKDKISVEIDICFLCLIAANMLYNIQLGLRS